MSHPSAFHIGSMNSRRSWVSLYEGCVYESCCSEKRATRAWIVGGTIKFLPSAIRGEGSRVEVESSCRCRLPPSQPHSSLTTSVSSITHSVGGTPSSH